MNGPPGFMMSSRLITYALRNFVNQIVDSTEQSPSLAEMLKKHLEVDWSRQGVTPFYVIYAVHDKSERFIELSVTDASGYPDEVYRRGHALLRIAVNGALTSPEDEEFAHAIFAQQQFRSCRVCGERFDTWLAYYGHAKLEHWGGGKKAM